MSKIRKRARGFTANNCDLGRNVNKALTKMGLAELKLISSANLTKKIGEMATKASRQAGYQSANMVLWTARTFCDERETCSPERRINLIDETKGYTLALSKTKVTVKHYH